MFVGVNMSGSMCNSLLQDMFVALEFHRVLNLIVLHTPRETLVIIHRQGVSWHKHVWMITVCALGYLKKAPFFNFVIVSMVLCQMDTGSFSDATHTNPFQINNLFMNQLTNWKIP